MKDIAIIPARGGSKRLPKKNIKIFCGKPLITWTIEAAFRSGQFDSVVVSTDCDEIASIARDTNAEVHKRSALLATDTATTEDVVADVIAAVEENGNKINTFTILQPTSPLRNAGHIVDAFNSFAALKEANVLVSVSECRYPLEFINRLGPNRSMKNFLKPEHFKRSQSLTQAFRLNGAIVICRRNMNKRFIEFYGDTSTAFVMDDISGVDIDTLEDFELAECLMVRYGGKV